MGMLKGNSGTVSFDQLMAQATQVALKQDASLMERARQKRKAEEERRRREEKAERERQETQAQLNRKRELQEKKQKLQLEQNKKQRDIDRKRSQMDKQSRSKQSNNAFNKKSTSFSSLLPEKKKPVDMSFEELMKKAKEQSTGKSDTKTSSSSATKSNTPSLYHPTKRHDHTKSSTSNDNSSLSIRERARQMISEPPKKVNSQKRDRRSITEIQRDIRRSKGIYSDDEDASHSKDPRLMSNRSKAAAAPVKPMRKRPLSPPPRKSPPHSKRPLSPPRSKRSISPPPRSAIRRPSSEKRPPPQAPLRRMPFTGRPLDRNRAAIPRRRYREEEEVDEDLADFVVDDEDDDPRYSRGPRRNSYSDEISKIFRYDRNRYAHEPVYSDDDMEADASDVLREEKRSARIARREDAIEEQKELERLERLKKKRKTQ